MFRGASKVFGTLGKKLGLLSIALIKSLVLPRQFAMDGNSPVTTASLQVLDGISKASLDLFRELAGLASRRVHIPLTQHTFDGKNPALVYI